MHPRPRVNDIVHARRALNAWASAMACCLLIAAFCLTVSAHQTQTTQATEIQNTQSALTPLQREIERERLRLSSSLMEERRDAVMRLGGMRRADSSRVATVALRDSSAIVRATAARAVISLPPAEAAAVLLPALQDRDEFVRQETAYALGETRSRVAVSALLAALNDKKDSVRGAAAVALGQIGDETAVVALTEVLARRVAASGIINKVRRKKIKDNEFVRRAAAHSLGQIGSRAAVPSLIVALNDEKAGDDVRREAAQSLGMIRDPSAINALRDALTARDPYLARLAYEALLKIAPAEATKPS
jgi:HEAT repeat protein